MPVVGCCWGGAVEFNLSLPLILHGEHRARIRKHRSTPRGCGPFGVGRAPASEGGGRLDQTLPEPPWAHPGGLRAFSERQWLQTLSQRCSQHVVQPSLPRD